MMAKLSMLIVVFLLLCSCSRNDKQAHEFSSKPPEHSGKISTTTTASPYANQIIRDNREGIVPKKIEIPAIQVNAPVIGVGLLKDGEMDVPSDGETTGWFNLGYKPGEPGNAAIAGHVSSKRGPAVFYNLKKLKLGDEVIITGAGSEKLTFVVLGVESYPRQQSPLNKIFGYTNRGALNLITCSGTYDRITTQNSERLVVYTQLKGE
jgi:LPXTG-site transpeptidase (sortase) family protein